ncbi:hypothetical protein [aff. Roholtiella sp. LEGE 12411]|uniref:hypothetical protein n=1 Tax=aff. Roholtiella sp. LEGE 12411 TaxID=1828822 RepID=UPI0018829F5F|nr:hypothetical protein [aff. Roholtiella sp. LEGE 12411]MBE9038332.1 hypothetical protein [aff. Roholtiella sp. LEGE 12411]
MSNFEYWNSYNPNSDFGSLMPPLFGTEQQSTVGNLQASSAGYDPLWVYQTYGSRLHTLPQDLQDAVFEAMRGGTNNQFLMQYISTYSGGATLNNIWAGEAKLYLPELQ